MPTVAELSEPYGNFLLGPRRGPDVCAFCFNLTDGYGRCYACAHGGRWLDAMVPISYSVAGEQLHHALAGYKRLAGEPGRRMALGLAAVLWRFLALHETCVARAARAQFVVATSVPSSRRAPDEPHRLRHVASRLVAPLRDRYQPLLRLTDTAVAPHCFSPHRYAADRDLSGMAVLLIDDTWTTGANAQSAAATLKAAGARTVAAVVIGRHVNRGWGRNDRRLRGLPRPFDWSRCALCAA